jgi:hypothetical protein
MALYLSGAGRSTRPTICRYKPILRVGRARMRQPTSGMSHPSVSTMQLVTTSISPAANCVRTASRCGLGIARSDLLLDFGDDVMLVGAQLGHGRLALAKAAASVACTTSSPTVLVRPDQAAAS